MKTQTCPRINTDYNVFDSTPIEISWMMLIVANQSILDKKLDKILETFLPGAGEQS